jgi:S-DNA-T family DNA segregation ATPase FtsK/SpoIIIE
MTIDISVADVRAALAQQTGRATGEGEAATLLLGRIFHEVFAEMIGADPERSGLRVIAEAGPDHDRRVAQLEHHVWTRLLAPRLLRAGAALQGSSAATHAAWRATKELCAWLTGVAVELLESAGAWEKLGASLRAEVPLSCELNEPGWSEPVRLYGVADSVLHLGDRKTYCAIELKLGRGAPAVDLGQAALYHLILSRGGGSRGSALALLRFNPARDERVISADAIADAQARLLALIASLAKVDRAEPRVSRPPDITPAPQIDAARYDELGKKLVRAYREQGVGIELREAPILGPRFVRFGVRLAPSVRIDGLRRRTAEVQHRLELKAEPLIVQQAGVLYVDVERTDPATILFSEIAPHLPEIDPLIGSAKVPIGVDPSGRIHYADLASAGRSHMLVAGTSGSGKSEWLRTLLAGLFASNTPDTLRVVSIDPKLAAFGDLERSAFLWRKNAWWIPGCGRQASEVFEDLVEEMDARYQLTRQSGSDNLAEHVARTKQPLARIVCVCDEYSALISQSKDEKQLIEQAVSLLGAKARAAGIHLVLATQQPSRATISGAIQTNLLCRVALSLSSPIESRMILGAGGAERLTGSGDLLYKDFGDPIRLQAPLLTAQERIARLGG